MSRALKQDTLSWSSLVTEISNVISKETGNVLSEKQFPMVEARLRRRCSELRTPTPEAYREYWRANLAEENKYLIGLLTTHFTSFFREFTHFEWIAKELPYLVLMARKEGRNQLNIWSAACSKGQEVWSLIMWLHHELPKVDPQMNFKVLGTDIDPASVEMARNGVYHRRELETAPRHLWENLWVRGNGDINDWYKIKSSLKKHAEFRTMNLLSLNLTANDRFDIVLSRNVLIYFDRENQEKICKSLLEHVTPHGTLITGLSESLSGYALPIKGVSPSVYKKLQAKIMDLPAAKRGPALVVPKPLRVLCVDDSPTVITILKKILHGPDYEVVGVASNGQEAMEKLETLKPDVITLDLHMPVMDGLTFLQQSGAASKYPVVVVSSVGREHAPMIDPLKKLGVCDFVEKPSLTNIAQIGEELCQKLTMSWKAKKSGIVIKDEGPSKAVKRHKGGIIFNFGPDDLDQVKEILRQQDWSGDDLTFLFNGSASIVPEIKSKLEFLTLKASSSKFITYESIVFSSKPTIWLNFKEASIPRLNQQKRPTDFIVMDESLKGDSKLEEIADDLSPYTSFAYLVDKLLGIE